MIAALPAALILRLLAGFTTGLASSLPFFSALVLAHRALCAAMIRARPAALILRFAGSETGWVKSTTFFGRPRLATTGVGAAVTGEEPTSEANSCSKASIFSLISAACFNCAEVNDNSSFIVIKNTNWDGKHKDDFNAPTQSHKSQIGSLGQDLLSRCNPLAWTRGRRTNSSPVIRGELYRLAGSAGCVAEIKELRSAAFNCARW